MTTYKTDREWSDVFLPIIKRLVGPYLLDVASEECDQKRAADLVSTGALTIACRVRSEKYAADYPWEFTVRSGRGTGVRTELDKIIDGHGSWLFYGHTRTDPEPDITRWFLIDLAAFRAAMIRNRMRPEVERFHFSVHHNQSDDTSFHAFDLRTFRPSIVLASSHEVPSMIEDVSGEAAA